MSAVIPYLNTVFENNSTLSRGEVFMYPVAKEIVKTWAAWAKETIANISDDPNGELDLFLKDSKKVSSILWPNDTVDFEFEIAKAKQRSNTKLLLADIKDKIRSGDNGIQDLLALSKKSLAKKSSRRSVSTNTKVSAISAEGKKQASAMIAAEINQHAVPAVKSFASSQTTLSSMSKLQPVVSNQTLSPLNRYLSPEKKKAIDAILTDRKDALTTELAAKENVIFQNYYSKGERDLKELASLVGYEGQLKKKYGALLSNNAFSNFNRDRQSLRQEILTVQENNIKAQINNTFDEKPIEALLTKHVHPKDRNTPKGKSLYAQKDTRFKELQALRDRNRIQDLNGMYLVSNDVIARIVQDKQGNRIAFKTLVEETSRKKLSKGALISKGVFDLKTQRLKTQGVAYPPVAGCGDIWNPTSLNEAVWSNKFLPLLAQDNQSDIKVWKQSESGGGPGKPCRIFETSISQCRVLRCLEWDDGKKNKLDKEANFIVKDLDRAKSIYAKLDKLSDQRDRELRAAERKHLGGSQSNPWDDYWDQRIDNARDSALDW